MKRTNFLLPVNFRFVGFLFFIAGLVLAFFRFYWGIKPEWLNFKPFAVVSSYIETKYMEVIGNNFAEEVTGFLLISGLFLIAFSKQKIEREGYAMVRLRAFFISAYLNFIFMLVALVFTYGFAFVYMLMLNMGFSLICYIVAFYLLRRQLPHDSMVNDLP